MKSLKIFALAALASVAIYSGVQAQDSYKFAVVPKAMNNPFFDLTRDGCVAEAAKLGNVECIYLGPVEHEPATQAQIIDDLITQGVDGLAISVSDIAAASTVIDKAAAAGIAVITFDSDAPDSKRTAYVGTNNKDFGKALGEELLKLKPEGGTYGLISGGAAAPNLAERVDGVREALAGSKWTEVSGSPTFSNDDIALAVQQASDLKTANPDIGAIVPVGGWPLFAPDGWKNFVEPLKADVDSKKLALVAADTLPVELQLLKDGYVHVLVGQRPYEMGEVAIQTLLKIKKGETVDNIIYTGLDRVTTENVDSLLK
ncbi:sugar ABC transporter substrate-binding protein [Metarhizobium album]|uniref:Sugar ABC transporter substrate-binding protein n=1 Tax=Metarhizobium album TaxID=2182425 RepID=A0A2U2DR55_9HYPH|nr:sugar-binding protein [Rhizobium album]OJT98358.1 MAG: sugar ABC transporter substrate-binding protein [Rhizobium sp. 63-7]PWE55781.1 sugar ABC transporter substrate-binding protein [Rhizobium album]